MAAELLTSEQLHAFTKASPTEQTRIKAKLQSIINKQLNRTRRPWHVWPAGNRVGLAMEAIEAMRQADLLFTKEDGTNKLLCVDIVLKIRPLPAGKLDKSASIVVQSVFQRLMERFGEDGKNLLHDRNETLQGVRYSKGFGLVFKDHEYFLQAVERTEHMLRDRLPEQPAQFSPSASSSDEKTAADS